MDTGINSDKKVLQGVNVLRQRVKVLITDEKGEKELAEYKVEDLHFRPRRKKEKVKMDDELKRLEFKELRDKLYARDYALGATVTASQTRDNEGHGKLPVDVPHRSAEKGHGHEHGHEHGGDAHDGALPPINIQLIHQINFIYGKRYRARGYGSMDYEYAGYQAAKLIKMDMLIAGAPDVPQGVRNVLFRNLAQAPQLPERVIQFIS